MSNQLLVKFDQCYRDSGYTAFKFARLGEVASTVPKKIKSDLFVEAFMRENCCDEFIRAELRNRIPAEV